MLVHNIADKTVALSISFSYADWCAAQHGLVDVIKTAMLVREFGAADQQSAAEALVLLEHLLPTEDLFLGASV